MNASERIKDIEENHIKDTIPVPLVEMRFIFKALNIYREISLSYIRANAPIMFRDCSEHVLEKEFEEKMKE